MKYILFPLLFFFTSCICQKNKTDQVINESPSSAEISLVLSDQYGGTETAQLQVIRKEATLKKFFADINKTRKPGIPVPEVDFSKEMVLIYCSGKTSDEEVPQLYSMGEKNGKMMLGMKKSKKKENTTSTAIKMPFGLYKMQLTDKEIILGENP